MKIKQIADFCTAVSIAKSLKGAVIISSSGFTVSSEGVWVKIPSEVETDAMMSVSPDISAVQLKKIRGEATIDMSGAYAVSGTDKNGYPVSCPLVTVDFEAIPDGAVSNKLSEIEETALSELLNMDITANQLLYLFFSKNSVMSLVMSNYYAGVSTAKAHSSSSIRFAISKNIASKLSSVLSKAEGLGSLTIRGFSCWDTKYIRLESEEGISITFELSDTYIPHIENKIVKLSKDTPCFTISAEDLKNIQIPKPKASDVCEITAEGRSSRIMASTLAYAFKILDCTDIDVIFTDNYTNFKDKHGHIFIAGNAK